MKKLLKGLSKLVTSLITPEMKKVVAIIVKNLFSENVLKSVFVKVGDYLVSSSKNKLL